MTFRVRLVLAATAAVLVVVVLGSLVTYIVAYNSLVGSVDVTLSADVQRVLTSQTTEYIPNACAPAGNCNQVVEPGQAREAACAMAERICANGPLAVRASLSALNSVAGSDEDAGWAATERAVAAIAGTADRQEGIDAFLEKRPPVWRGA